MKWFKHDTDASIDAKLQELLLDYGASGYGLYWYCIELIAQGVGENNITFELEHDARIISKTLNLSIKETQDMMKKMIDLGLFSIGENNRLACYSLAKRLDQSMTSSTAMRAVIASLKSANNAKDDSENHDLLPKSHDKVMTKSDFIMQEENRIEKNIYIGDKKSPISKPSFDDSLVDELKKEITLSEQGVDLVIRFLKYRRKIKKQIKIVSPIKLFVKEIAECKKLGYEIEEIFTLMQEKQWQSLKAEWVINSLPKPTVTDMRFKGIDMGGYTT